MDTPEPNVLNSAPISFRRALLSPFFSSTGNVALQDTLESILRRGIPVPWHAYSTFPCTGVAGNSFVHKIFLGDSDGLTYKIEASGDLPHDLVRDFSENRVFPIEAACTAPDSVKQSKRISCADCKGVRPSPDQTLIANQEAVVSCLRRGAQEIMYVPPSQLLIFVSYPFFNEVWDFGAAELFEHHLTGKPLAQCRITPLNKALHGFDLLVEVAGVSRDSDTRRELAFQLSRMRQRLQCGVFQRYLRSIYQRRISPVKQVNIRDDETILMSATEMHIRFIFCLRCNDPVERFVVFLFCQEIAKLCEKDVPERLSANASLLPPHKTNRFTSKSLPSETSVYLHLVLHRAPFASDVTSANRSFRAITLGDMIVSVTPRIRALVCEHRKKSRRLWQSGAFPVRCYKNKRVM